MQKNQEGFTLIEILIVVAIIAILASVVLVGLGPAQQSGRDARRLSDLREVQTGLELYYNGNGTYPETSGSPASGCTDGKGGSAWCEMANVLENAGIGINQVPNDPVNNSTYYYAYGINSGKTEYAIGCTLENKSNAVFAGYEIPYDLTAAAGSDEVTSFALTCTGQADAQWCISL